MSSSKYSLSPKDASAWMRFALEYSKKLSLVDCSSFEIMRQSGIQTAFALDRDFSAHGFDVVP